MSSPFDRHRDSAQPTAINLRAWCDEQNRKRISEHMERWYYVAEKDDGQFIDALTGTDGGNVRKMLAGELRDFYGWAPARMDGYRRWMWSVAERGLIDPPRPAHPANAYQSEAAE